MASTSATSKTDKAAPELHDCLCGCGTQVKSKFATGHDAKYAARLRVSFESGDLTAAKAQAAAAKVSPAFAAKVARSLELAKQRQAAAKAESAKDES